MSPRTLIPALIALLLALTASTALAATGDLHSYLAGYAYQFAYGSGISSSRPRVTLFIQYCPSGVYHSAGQSCRPNLYASGYQCSSIQDSGRWQVQDDQLQWLSISGERGSVQLLQHPNGSVTDPRGNLFVRQGLARCP